MISKFYIPFDKYNWTGGPPTFMRNFKSYLKHNNYQYKKKYSKGDSIFFPIKYDIHVLKEIKKNGGTIIQRLDGVYYPSKHPDNYQKANKDIKYIYQNLADHIVFQSEYSKKQCFAMFGEKNEDEYSIIFNGADLNIFYPNLELPQPKEKFKFITTSAFRNKDQIEPIINAFDQLNDQLKFEFNIIGNISSSSIEPFFKREYINYLGEIPNHAIASYLRDNHIFIYSHLNPPCPNSIIEAISCGLPVVSYNSGAIKELCHFSTDLLADVSDNIFQNYKDFSQKKIIEKIILATQNYTYYRNIALKNSKLYNIQNLGERYIKVFENSIVNEKHEKNGLIKKLIKRTINNKLFNKYLWPQYQNRILNFSNKDFLKFFKWYLESKNQNNSSFDMLKHLFELEKIIYSYEGQNAVRYGNGTHTKHYHTKYHSFFINNIRNGEKILDIGCGKGELAYDIANKVSDINITGIDINENNIKECNKKYTHPNIYFICEDALKYSKNKKFNTIILSNVLEHIEFRTKFLKQIQKNFNPDKYLIRVPLYERDWRVPLKDEIGVDYRLDSTHFTEYIQEDFITEIQLSGLEIKNYQIRWGEIWAVIIPHRYQDT